MGYGSVYGEIHITSGLSPGDYRKEYESNQTRQGINLSSHFKLVYSILLYSPKFERIRYSLRRNCQITFII
jgi:hypothetical protein